MEDVPRVLLILPTATYRANDFLEAAAALGIEVAVASEEAQPLAEQMGDRFLQIDCRQPESAAARIVELADRSPIDAIMAVDDTGVVVAALAATELRLPHNPPQAVAATRNKALLRRRLERAEVSQPAFELVGAGDDVAALAAVVGFPCVFKPLSLSAGRGVIRVDDPEQAAPTAERIRRILAAAGHNPNEPLLVESYLPGIEVAVEGLLRDGRLEVLAVFDKPEPQEGPYFEETILITPSRLHPEMQDEVRAVTARAAAALGLREGPVHAELRVDGSRVSPVEVAARSIGGLCGRALRFGLLGTPLEAVLLRHALGMPDAGLRRQEEAAGVMMLPIPRAGRFREIRNQHAARAVPGITDIEVTVPAGEWIAPVPEGGRYLGFLFARGATPDEVEGALRAAHTELEVVIES